MSAKIIRFPHGNAREFLQDFQKMMDEGTIKEVIIYAPDAKDADGHYIEMSDGVRLMDILMVKQILSSVADRFEDII